MNVHLNAGMFRGKMMYLFNTHAHLLTWKMAENKLSVVSDTTDVDSVTQVALVENKLSVVSDTTDAHHSKKDTYVRQQKAMHGRATSHFTLHGYPIVEL